MINSGANLFPGALGVVMVLVVLVIVSAATAFKLFLWWRVFSKAGYSGALGMLMLVPFGGMIILCVLAFSQWPILKASTARQKPGSKSEDNSAGHYGNL